MKINLVPTGGLGNRMRAIASGIAIAEHYHSKINIFWNNSDGLRADFTQLFLPIENPYVHFVANDKWLYKIDGKKDFLLRLPLLNLLSKKVIFNHNIYNKSLPDIFEIIGKQFSGTLTLVSCNPMCNEYKMQENFVPCPDIQRRIEEITRKYNTNTVGIHIRRTDNVQSIANSPLEAFYDAIEKEIAKDSNVNFYLATDSEDVKEEISSRYPERIITLHDDTSRNTLEGMKFAVVDMYCLSKTKKIIGSVYSSYSMIASELGAIEVEYAKK